MTLLSESQTSASTETLADTLQHRLASIRSSLSDDWRRHTIAHLTLDDLLPTATAHWLSEGFPKEEQMRRVKSLAEHKYVTQALQRLCKPLDELLCAFQSPELVRTLADITGARELQPDVGLAASGLVSIGPGGFEAPHLDASHDQQGVKYCVLKAIYYLSPDWRLADGGQLELWEDGLTGLPTVTLAKFNRLTLIGMNGESWHSINPVHAKRPRRALVHCYYAPAPLGARSYRHLRTFRGRPEQPVRDMILRQKQNMLAAFGRNPSL